MKIAISFITFWACLISSSNAMTCEEENFLGLTTYKTCPGPLDASDMIYCCGTKSNRVCCNQVFGLGEEDLEKLASKLPAIIGVLFAVAVGLIILCIICCCCCPFCLLHKKRSRGVVHNPVPHQAQMAPMNAPPSQMYAPVQHGAYPPQPYPPQGYPAQPMVQPQQAQAPYPTSQPPPQPQNDNPPPYAEKQMPYNPNY